MKTRAGQVEAQQSYFHQRCDSMNQLLREMTLSMQNLYYGNKDGNIDKTLERMSILRSSAILAKSYLGEESSEIYRRDKHLLEEQQADGETLDPSISIAISINALANELRNCNSPGAFPMFAE